MVARHEDGARSPSCVGRVQKCVERECEMNSERAISVPNNGKHYDLFGHSVRSIVRNAKQREK
jgi:hypothetical protein